MVAGGAMTYGKREYQAVESKNHAIVDGRYIFDVYSVSFYRIFGRVVIVTQRQASHVETGIISLRARTRPPRVLHVAVLSLMQIMCTTSTLVYLIKCT